MGQTGEGVCVVLESAASVRSVYRIRIGKDLDAHKQFFVKRAKLHFRASKFSMISRWHNMGILGKVEFWAGAQPNPSQHMHSGSSQTEIGGDNPYSRQLSGRTLVPEPRVNRSTRKRSFVKWDFFAPLEATSKAPRAYRNSSSFRVLFEHERRSLQLVRLSALRSREFL